MDRAINVTEFVKICHKNMIEEQQEFVLDLQTVIYCYNCVHSSLEINIG